MKKQISKGYSVLLAIGGLYYLVLAVSQYNLPYLQWESWANPSKDASAYGVLIVIYALNIGTPAVMLCAGYLLFKKEKISIYLALLLAALLVLAPLIGKLILLVGIFIVFVLKSGFIKNT